MKIKSHFEDVDQLIAKIKSHFEDVDQLIAKIKAVTIKNKTREAKSMLLVTHLSLFLQDGEAG